MMYEPINGFTKQKMIDVINEKFTIKSEAGGKCAYRGTDNARCAVGCFIPDDIYTPAMDDMSDSSAWIMLQKYPQLQPLMPLDSNAMGYFQKHHDDREPLPNQSFKDHMIMWVQNNVKETI